MAMSSKKITYTSDFKLKVLDYYFKNGGDENFGLKKKTAQHFNIDKKTINRMLNNPEMVKRARKLLTRKVTPPPKTAPSTRQTGAKTSATKGTKVAASRVNVASTSTRVTASSHNSASSNSSSSSYKTSTSSASSTKHVGGNSSSGQGSSSQPTKSATSKTKSIDHENENGVQVFDLPEDPDYSILKKSINASTNGVANLAKLLVTGTKEVKNLILNECDVILECKVCNNLFRSVVNFLAHKRIYCQEEYADVRSLFHKDNVQGITSHSRTVVVEPEPPPDTTPQHIQPDPTTSASNTLTVPVRPGVQRSERRSGIDSIARRLANKKRENSLSSSTHTGSSEYYQRISDINDTRDKLSRDCSVVLEDIGGVANAMFQTYLPPSKSSPVPTIRKMIDEVSEHEKGVTVAINENGEIMKTAAGNVTNMEVDETSTSTDSSKDIICRICNTRFATQKTLSVHQRTQHGYERNVYCCPICQTTFFNVMPVVRHLQRVHKKTRSQIERLRKVIKKNMYKKMVYQRDELKEQEELDKSSEKELEKDEDDDENDEEEDQERDQNGEEEEEREEVDPDDDALSDHHTKMDVDSSPQKRNSANITPKNSPIKSPMKGDENDTGCQSDHRCVKCDRRFMTASALLSHDKFCSLLQMRPDIPPESPLNPRLRSETPEKKIAIQIRKDYKKTMALPGSGSASHGEEDKSQLLTFKVPHVPKELQFLKDPQSPKESQQSKELQNSEELRAQQQEYQAPSEEQKPKATQTSAATHRTGDSETAKELCSQSKIEALLKQFCNVSRLACIPCEKRYQTFTTLKRHASQHFDWTRFSCTVCKFRSYHRYEAMRHCVNEHQASEEDVAKMIQDDEYIGPLKYYINTAPSNLVSSRDPIEADESDSQSEKSEKETKESETCNDDTGNKEKEERQNEEKVLKMPEEKVNQNNDDNKIENSLTLAVKEDLENESENEHAINSSIKTSNQKESTEDLVEPISESSGPESSKIQVREDAEQSVKKENDFETGIEEVSLSEATNRETKDKERVILLNIQSPTVVLKQYPLRDQKDQSVALFSGDSEEGKCERPQRTRRSVEQKDFIYSVKRSNSVKSENEIGKRSNLQHKNPEGRSRKRSLSARFEMISKKRKVSESSLPEPCNGSATQSTLLKRETPVHHAMAVSNGNNELDTKLTLHGSPHSKKNLSTVLKVESEDSLHAVKNSSEGPERETDVNLVVTEIPGISKKINTDRKEESNAVEGQEDVKGSCSVAMKTVEETEVENKNSEDEVRLKMKTASGTEKGRNNDSSKEVIPHDKTIIESQPSTDAEESEVSSKNLIDEGDTPGSKTLLSVTALPNSDASETQVQSKNPDVCVLENGNYEPLDKDAEKIGASVLSDTLDIKLEASSCQTSQRIAERKLEDNNEDEVKKQKQKEDLLETMRAVYNKPRDDINE